MNILGERGSTLPTVIGGGGPFYPHALLWGGGGPLDPGLWGKGVHSTLAVFPFIPYKAPTCKTGNSKVY